MHSIPSFQNAFRSFQVKCHAFIPLYSYAKLTFSEIKFVVLYYFVKSSLLENVSQRKQRKFKRSNTIEMHLTKQGNFFEHNYLAIEQPEV